MGFVFLVVGIALGAVMVGYVYVRRAAASRAGHAEVLWFDSREIRVIPPPGVGRGPVDLVDIVQPERAGTAVRTRAPSSTRAATRTRPPMGSRHPTGSRAARRRAQRARRRAAAIAWSVAAAFGIVVLAGVVLFLGP